MPAQIFASLLFLLLLAALYILYSFGFSGIFSFDDASTLDGLLTVNDWSSAMQYLTTGETGPLGRPIALASFLFEAADYPDSAAGFLQTNTLIHLVNVAFVWLILLRLQRLIPKILPSSPCFAPLTAFFWGVLPLIASTSMMVVQRMTSLSALFVLLGVLIYLWGRTRADQLKPVILTAVGIGLCTALAAFTKENGALLPLLLVVLEFTLLSGVPNSDPKSLSARLLNVSILLPSLMSIIYLLTLLPGLEGSYASRPFDLQERAATELVILWDYLRLAFIPRPLALGPFHDDYPILDFSSPLVWIAAAAWIFLIGFALLRRRTLPLLTFAVFWYLVGHLLESTVFPLELYFEHRNYLPILGPVIAMAAFSTQLPVQKRLRLGISGLYLIFLTFVLWQTIDIWGKRHQELWARQHPNSPRAVQTVAQTYYAAGYRDESLKMLEDTWARNPHLSSVGMQALRLRCYLNDEAASRNLLNSLVDTLNTSHFSYLTLHAFENIRKLQASNECRNLTSADLHALADALLANPRFRAHGSIRQQLHRIKGQLFIEEEQVSAAIDQLEKAFAIKADVETLLLLYNLLQSTGKTTTAAELLDKAVVNAPDNYWQRDQWLSVVKALQGNVTRSR